MWKKFDQVPKVDDNSCFSLSSTPTGYYFDECSHKFSLPPTGYTIYEKNQFCQIKNIKCDNAKDYYLDIDDNDKNYICRHKDLPRETYYFDINESNNDKKFKKCFRSCLKCSSQGTDTDNKCDECHTDKGFYSITFDSSPPKQCYHKDVPIPYYFFDKEEQKFKKCRKECLTCTELSSDFSDYQTDETNESKDTKCTKCDISNDYFPQVDNPSNCIHKDRNSVVYNIKYHYYNDDYKRWEKCTDGCIYCKKYGESIEETNCLKKPDENVYCYTSDYYPVETDDPADSTNVKKCFKKDKRYDHYYFDEDSNIFKKCDDSCLQCDNNYHCLPDKCDTKNNYFPREDDHKICYRYDKINYNYITDYYFDPNTKLFKRCHESCSECREQIDVSDDDTQCHTCKSDYYPLNGSEFEQDNKNCYHKDREGYYFKDNKMYKCPEKCAKCEYISLTSSGTEKIYCTECNNELKFFQIENTYLFSDEDNKKNKYMECFTWRREKLISTLEGNENNVEPPLNTSLVGNVFKICNQACTQCTGISPNTEKFVTHCQAKKCSAGYIYVQNHEDICYLGNDIFPLHYKYHDPFLNEDYFKPCYQTCQTCKQAGTKRNNFCDTCREGYIMHPNQITNQGNCVFDCLKLAHNNYYYLDEDNNDEYTCVEKCPEEYPFLQPDEKRCVKSCDTYSNLKYSKDRICVESCPDNTNNNLNKECVSISNECAKSDLESTLILYDINDTNINKLIVDYCHDYSYTSSQVNNITNRLNEYNITLYKSKKCVHEFYGNNINFPDLSVCFGDLRKHYDISPNQELIVMIMNIFNGNSFIKVEYKVFDSITCQELDLSYCNVKKIFTYINMELYFDESEIKKAKDMYINKNINVYDRDHPFFTDLCYQYTYNEDKDMILEDRVNMYYQDISKICERKCKPEADFDKKLIKCGCPLKEKFLVNNNDNIDDSWNFGIYGVSLDVLKCSGKAFHWDYFKENIGSYTSLVLIVAEFPVIIYFIINGLSQVKIFLIPFMGANPPKKDSIIENKNDIDSNKESNNSNEEGNNEDNINNDINTEDNINKKSSSHSRSIKKLQTINTINSNLQSSKGFTDNKTDDSFIRKDLSESRQQFVKKKYDIYKDIIDIEDLNDVELYDARNLDNRAFCQFYYQELKNTQSIIYSFFYYTPLTPRYFKILHFIFNTTLCFVFNAFFFSKFYISEKCFEFENSFSWYFRNIFDRIIYTCLCTVMISLILRVLTSSKKKMFMWIKREKDPEVFNKEITKMMKKMKLNYILFSSIQGAFMFLFWLYLSCFCIAYKNNEMEWFVTSWICFGLIQIWYFISTFIVTCLRYLGIKFGMESCYNVSLCLAFD